MEEVEAFYQKAGERLLARQKIFGQGRCQNYTEGKTNYCQSGLGVLYCRCRGGKVLDEGKETSGDSRWITARRTEAIAYRLASGFVEGHNTIVGHLREADGCGMENIVILRRRTGN